MRYYLNYQHLAQGASRPTEQGPTVEIDMQGDGHALIPNVGDFVQLENSRNEMASIRGRVRSRFFFYTGGTANIEGACAINIVLEDAGENWGELMKS